ncbi:MAG: SpoIIE family protein phosphatase [Krumholzibacteria bacterium]|nr:SpoIIE family protein phosphatase [Candidatus Krumholzibacteria bacterium]
MNSARHPADHEQEIRRLRRAVEELAVLNDLAQAVAAAGDEAGIMRTVVHHAARAVRGEQAMIHPIKPGERAADGTLVATNVGHHAGHFTLGAAITGMLGALRRPVVVDDPHGDPRLQGARLDADLRDLVCVPMIVGDRVVGALTVCNKQGGGGFDADDVRLLAIIAGQSAQVLERMRDRERSDLLLRSLLTAADIQRGLLPVAPPVVPGYDIAGATRPAWDVGGDYFDYIPLDDGRWGLALGDVSGKGIPAALLMANLQATLRGVALQDLPCHQGMAWCNRLLHRSTAADRFATLFYCVLDPARHHLQYCNAGHEHPLILARDGSVRARLDQGGIPAGILADPGYESGEAALDPGDMLLVYSDGATDMENGREEPFGIARLLETVCHHRDAGAALIATTVMEEVRRHAAGEPPTDDTTLLIVKRDRG